MKEEMFISINKIIFLMGVYIWIVISSMTFELNDALELIFITLVMVAYINVYVRKPRGDKKWQNVHIAMENQLL